jgi:hypothetical protein
MSLFLMDPVVFPSPRAGPRAPSPVSSLHALLHCPTGARFRCARAGVIGPLPTPSAWHTPRWAPAPSHFPPLPRCQEAASATSTTPFDSLSLSSAQKTTEQSTLMPPSPMRATSCPLPSLDSTARHRNWLELCRRFPPL